MIAPGDSLLESYHTERHPIGKAVLRSSGTLVRLAMARKVRQRTTRALFARAVSTIPPIRRRAGVASGPRVQPAVPVEPRPVCR